MSVEIPAGAMRFNSDSQKLEYWNGSAWFQVHTATPNLATAGDPTPGARGLFAGGYQQPGGYQNDIDYINIASTGNTQDFGTLNNAVTAGGGVGSRTRALFAGGYIQPSPNGLAQIDTVVFASTGNASDFGDLNNSGNIRRGTAGNATRGLFAGGGVPTSAAQIDYVTIATTGTANDLGDLTVARSRFGGGGSPVRGVFAGGFGGPSPASVWYNVIDFVNIATIGNAQDFGDLTQEKSWTGSCSNATRMIIGGGDKSPGYTAVSETEYLTIASGGNAVIFGDLNKVVDTGTYTNSGVASPTRGVFTTGLFLTPSTTYVNTLYYVQISTQGQAQDFGDLDGKRYGVQTCSNAHGGL
tara:strand:+ start:867 stop:1931 length:1065 start_codon:yes stop_codon:yes gene_type:complete